jgi:hypothetical protein
MAHRDKLAGLAEVSCRRQSRLDLLTASITARDPELNGRRVFLDGLRAQPHDKVSAFAGRVN